VSYGVDVLKIAGIPRRRSRTHLLSFRKRTYKNQVEALVTGDKAEFSSAFD